MIAYIALGSNLLDPANQLQMALGFIGNLSDTEIKKVSSVYLTAPVGVLEQPDFLNQVIEIDTKLSVFDLLHSLQDIENKMGRVRDIRWGPRVIDCDILLYEGIKIETDELTVPHPRMMERDFVLMPLAEIAPGLVLSANM